MIFSVKDGHRIPQYFLKQLAEPAWKGAVDSLVVSCENNQCEILTILTVNRHFMDGLALICQN